MSEPDIRVPGGLTTDGLLGRRYLARCIDSVLIAMSLFVSTWLLGALLQGHGRVARLLLLPLTLVVWLGYGAFLEASAWQATLGKRLMGLRVYNAQGGRLALMQSAGRNLVKDGPFLALGFVPSGQWLGLLWLGAHLVVIHRSAVNQAIHDRAIGTWVAAPEATTQLHLA